MSCRQDSDEVMDLHNWSNKFDLQNKLNVLILTVSHRRKMVLASVSLDADRQASVSQR